MNTNNNNKNVLLELMHSIEVRKQTEHRLKATMSVLLARSENQILVLETLLKRLVQVCVHTQDKRLAKELKLMDFTRLAKKIGDDHTQMRQMIMQEDGMLSSASPSDQPYMDPMGSRNPHGVASGGTGAPGVNSSPMLDEPGSHPADGASGAAMGGPNAVNLSQFRGGPAGPGGHMPMQQMMPGPHSGGGGNGGGGGGGPGSGSGGHPGLSGPGSAQNSLQNSGHPGAAQMRREGSQALSPGVGGGNGGPRDAMNLRQLWPENGNMDSAGMMPLSAMGNGVGMAGGMGGAGSMMQGGGGTSGAAPRMRMGQPPRPPSQAGSLGQPPSGASGQMRSYADNDAFSGFS